MCHDVHYACCSDLILGDQLHIFLLTTFSNFYGELPLFLNSVKSLIKEHFTNSLYDRMFSTTLRYWYLFIFVVTCTHMLIVSYLCSAQVSVNM